MTGNVDGPTVLGIDPGLQALGFAWSRPAAGVQLHTCKTGSRRGSERLAHINGTVKHMIAKARPTYALIEDYAYQRGRGAHQLGEAGGAIRLALYEFRVPWFAVSPSSLKLWMTGHGAASKERMVVTAQLRLGAAAVVQDDHQADALALHWLGVEASALWPTPMLGELGGHVSQRTEAIEVLESVRSQLPADLLP